MRRLTMSRLGSPNHEQWHRQHQPKYSSSPSPSPPPPEPLFLGCPRANLDVEFAGLNLPLPPMIFRGKTGLPQDTIPQLPCDINCFRMNPLQGYSGHQTSGCNDTLTSLCPSSALVDGVYMGRGTHWQHESPASRA